MPELPDRAVARDWLATMTLYPAASRSAPSEMYARARRSGASCTSRLGEEATIVGQRRGALRDSDYLISHLPLVTATALVRGTRPRRT